MRRSATTTTTALLCIALIASTVPHQSYAAEAAAPPADEGPRAVRVTTFAVPSPKVDARVLPSALRALEEGLKRNPRLEMKDLETRLADFAQEIPQSQIDEGRTALEEGRKALQGLELPLAIKKLQLAIDALGKVLPHIKKQELADAMMALGTAQMLHGDKREGKATFVRLLTWRPDLKFNAERHPPTLVPAFEEARREVERTRRGSLEIRSEPAGAQAYVDGKYVGLTPAFAEALTAGEHWVTIKKEGFRKAVMPGNVSARVQQVASVLLERSGKYLLVEQSLANIDKTLGSAELDASVDNLKEVLFIDHGIFVRAKPADAGAVQLESFLYDLRTRRRLSLVTRKVAATEIDRSLGDLASALYANVNYDAELEAPAEAPPPKPVTRRKFYKTWWFWTVIGVVAVGGTLAGVLTPKPINCPEGQCFKPSF